MQLPNGTRGNTSHDVYSVKIGPPVRAQRDPKNEILKKYYEIANVTGWMFAQTTHVVASPHGFAGRPMVLPAT